MEEDKLNSPAHGPFIVPAAIIVAGALIAWAIVYTRAPRPAPSASSGTAAVSGEAQTPVQNLADDDPTLGNPQAPVLIVEFGDFQCPFCGKFFQESEPRIIAEYVKTGKARLVYRDFAFLGDESRWAAIAAECADDQNKFWAYHDFLYRNQHGENQGAFTKENLKRFAVELGLNRAEFDSCLDTERHRAEIQKDRSDATRIGVRYTPTVFINQQKIEGALEYSVFKDIIEEELAKSK